MLSASQREKQSKGILQPKVPPVEPNFTEVVAPNVIENEKSALKRSR